MKPHQPSRLSRRRPPPQAFLSSLSLIEQELHVYDQTNHMQTSGSDWGLYAVQMMTGNVVYTTGFVSQA